MNVLGCRLRPISFLVLALFLFSSAVRGATIFDSFTPPDTEGGFSSANSGAAIQVSVAYDLTITGMSVLTEMAFGPGSLRFAVYSYPQTTLLLVTDPIPFSADAHNVPTWKESGTLNFTLNGGHKYLLGYFRDVAVLDVGDHIAESGGGVTSDLFVHCLSGFQNPTYSHACIGGIDFGLRLEAVPEPSAVSLLLCCGAAGGIGVLLRRRKNIGRRNQERA